MVLKLGFEHALWPITVLILVCLFYAPLKSRQTVRDDR
jgi:hypothetical protein